eukprot:362630-Chlamydomonas_euryale.AAC.3
MPRDSVNHEDDDDDINAVDDGTEELQDEDATEEADDEIEGDDDGVDDPVKKTVAKQEKERLRLQAAKKKEMLEQMRQQNVSAERGEVTTAAAEPRACSGTRGCRRRVFYFCRPDGGLRPNELCHAEPDHDRIRTLLWRSTYTALVPRAMPAAERPRQQQDRVPPAASRSLPALRAWHGGEEGQKVGRGRMVCERRPSPPHPHPLGPATGRRQGAHSPAPRLHATRRRGADMEPRNQVTFPLRSRIDGDGRLPTLPSLSATLFDWSPCMQDVWAIHRIDVYAVWLCIPAACDAEPLSWPCRLGASLIP